MKKIQKPYWEMSTAELRQATREFDKPMPGIPGKPLTAGDRHLLQQAKRKGRPRIGLGAEKVRVSLERGLLHMADAAAKKLHLTRSQFIAHSLRASLQRAV